MALASQRPVLCSFLYPPRCHIPIRTFTSTPRACRVSASGQPSMSVESRKRMTELGAAAFPTDLGLLPDTLIMPTGARLPSIFFQPKLRAQLEWIRLKRRVMDFGSVLYYKWGMVRGDAKLKRPTIERSKMGTIARDLHHEMYSAFAEGDTTALNTVCASGLASKFITRIHRREPNESLRWSVERYFGAPRVVSHRVAALPEPPMTALRQAVVRIRSSQVVEKVKGAKKNRKQPQPDDSEGLHGESKAMDELVVIQKIMVNGKEGQWIVWGTTGESDAGQIVQSMS